MIELTLTLLGPAMAVIVVVVIARIFTDIVTDSFRGL